MSFWPILPKLVPRKLLGNCKFAKFVKYNSLKKIKSFELQERILTKLSHIIYSLKCLGLDKKKKSSNAYFSYFIISGLPCKHLYLISYRKMWEQVECLYCETRKI